MATRDEVYRRFGLKLVEAIVLVIIDEINILRTDPNTVRAARTEQQILNAIAAKLATLENYSWQT